MISIWLLPFWAEIIMSMGTKQIEAKIYFDMNIMAFLPMCHLHHGGVCICNNNNNLVPMLSIQILNKFGRFCFMFHVAMGANNLFVSQFKHQPLSWNIYIAHKRHLFNKTKLSFFMQLFLILKTHNTLGFGKNLLFTAFIHHLHFWPTMIITELKKCFHHPFKTKFLTWILNFVRKCHLYQFHK